MALRLVRFLALIGITVAFRAEDRAQTVLAANSTANQSHQILPIAEPIDPSAGLNVLTHYIQSGECPKGIPNGKFDVGMFKVDMEGRELRADEQIAASLG